MNNATIFHHWRPSPSGLIGNLYEWQQLMLMKYPNPAADEMYDMHINVCMEKEVAYRFIGWFESVEYNEKVQRWRREARKTTRVSFFLKLNTQKGEVIPTPDGEFFRDVSDENDCSRYKKVELLKLVKEKGVK